jgi:toxin-antitoxin system PIN domain toxin
MIAVDTNILVYAHREDSPWHVTAYQRLTELAQGRSLWAIPWPCLFEFLAIITHPRIYQPPTPLELALDQIEAWIESPSLVVLSETEGHWSLVRSLISDGKIVGPRIHDARVAALCQSHGITELWTADRDFSRFPSLVKRNPLLD